MLRQEDFVLQKNVGKNVFSLVISTLAKFLFQANMHYDCIIEVNTRAPEIILLLVGSGFLIGVVNTLAGSGTAIGYAVFMLLGLPPAYANGTVRIGVIPQTFAASFNFYRKGFLKIRQALYISVPITAGSVLGAQIAVSINQEVFKYIIGTAMILMLFFVIYKPQRWLQGVSEQRKEMPKLWQIIVYFLIGTYGGFIHIGVGIFLLAALVLVSGYDLLSANSYKVFVVLVYTPFALAVFIFNDHIHYALGLISAVGNTLGGIAASKFALRQGAGALRWILIVVLVVFSVHLFGMFEWLAGLF